MNKRILITGAQGFLGRYLAEALIKGDKHLEVIGIGRSQRLDDCFTHSLSIKNNQTIPAPLPVGMGQILSKRYQYFAIDTNDKKQLAGLLETRQPTAIIHLASGLKGDHCSKLLNTNITGTLNLLSASKKYLINVPFVSISSGGVYGFPLNPGDLPFKESHPCNPEESYQLTKAAEEKIVEGFCEQFDIPWLALRVFNIIGPGQDERHVCGRFVSELIRIKNRYKNPYLKTSGLASVRDFVDVRDVANNIIRLLANRQYNQVFNIASGTPVVIKDVLDRCLNAVLANGKGRVEIDAGQQTFFNDQKIDQHYGDNTRLLNAGGAINFSLASSIKDMVSYYGLIYRQA
jgi:nucleoside-diphosphate-sugar epimerase